MDRNRVRSFPWRMAILGPLITLVFTLALYLYNGARPRLGLGLLGVAFALAMGWVLLAARVADYGDSPLRGFVPRLAVWLVLGSVILGAMHWNSDRRITAMELGFAALYLAVALIAIRTLDRRPKRPQLAAISGGNLERRQPRRHK